MSTSPLEISAANIEKVYEEAQATYRKLAAVNKMLELHYTAAGDATKTLEFRREYGKAIEESYGVGRYDIETLQRIIDSVNADIRLKESLAHFVIG